MGAIFAIEKDGVVYLGADAVKSCCDVNFYVNNESNKSIKVGDIVKVCITASDEYDLEGDVI